VGFLHDNGTRAENPKRDGSRARPGHPRRN
jgi:hypothetical protein